MAHISYQGSLFAGATLSVLIALGFSLVLRSIGHNPFTKHVGDTVTSKDGASLSWQ